MSIKTVSQSQLGQDTAKNSQIVTTAVKLINSGASTGPAITSVIVTDSGYNTLDDTAAATSNSYIRILGTGFQSTANVFLNGTMVPKANVTFVSSTELRAVLPVSNTGNYAVSVYNSNSAGALYSSTFVISTMPQWLTSATLANTQSGIAFSRTLSATSDSNITYSNTTALPAGTTLAANGLFSGTITVGSQTTYSFDVKATDAENQDSTRTFSLTTTFIPTYRYLRVVINSVNGGGSQAQLTELSLRDSNGSLITQSLSSPVAPSAGSLSNLINDASPSNDDTNMNPLPFTLNYDLLSGKVLGTDVKFLQIGSSDDSTRYASSITVSGSNDNSNWTEIISGAPPSYAGIRVRQNWTIY
jgi:hypothetical protein